MIAQSQSGTGKTAAFSLTMLSRISYDLQQPQVNCLSYMYRRLVANKPFIAGNLPRTLSRTRSTNPRRHQPHGPIHTDEDLPCRQGIMEPGYPSRCPNRGGDAWNGHGYDCEAGVADQGYQGVGA